MTAIREQIFVAIETALAAIALNPTVRRMVVGDFTSFPALNIDDTGQDPSDEESGVQNYDLAVTIEGFVEQPGGNAAHAELSELHAQVVKALKTEPLLGGLVSQVTEGPMRVDVAQFASTRRLGFAADFTINFATRAGDPASN